MVSMATKFFIVENSGKSSQIEMKEVIKLSSRFQSPQKNNPEKKIIVNVSDIRSTINRKG
jgi:hypothetical protein